MLRKLSADDPLRRPAVIEMIKIDLERRRRIGQRVRLEAYLRHLPELGSAQDPPVDLILAEYQVRRQFGVSSGLLDYARRFPRQVEDLRRRIKEADRLAVSRQTVYRALNLLRQGLAAAGGRNNPEAACDKPAPRFLIQPSCKWEHEH